MMTNEDEIREALEEQGITRDAALKAYEQIKREDAPIEHLYCGHCGGIEDVKAVDFVAAVRHLCVVCRIKILEWI
jgi:predicted RNA-binding protein associated with RNAse of E/G family